MSSFSPNRTSSRGKSWIISPESFKCHSLRPFLRDLWHHACLSLNEIHMFKPPKITSTVLTSHRFFKVRCKFLGRIITGFRVALLTSSKSCKVCLYLSALLFRQQALNMIYTMWFKGTNVLWYLRQQSAAGIDAYHMQPYICHLWVLAMWKGVLLLRSKKFKKKN